ncbi:S24 family peptidase [Psychrobacter sp. ASPA161_6]|uniref:S24 family peptidase n=1 Tax=Psychrobacter sp. ASPA161_6 TaxID=3160962 RepID=UPI003F7F0DEC
MSKIFTSIDDIRRDNVRRLMQQYKTKRMDLSQGTKINYALLGHYIGKNPIKAIGDETASKIEVFFNKPSNWLDHEHNDLAQEVVNNLSKEIIDSLIEIPVYKYFSFNKEKKSCDFEDVKDICSFHLSFFESKDIEPDYFRMTFATDNSMQPYINIQDRVGLTIDSTFIEDGSIYAIILNGKHAMFKQIFIETDNMLRLHSLNKDYPDKLVKSDKTENLIIVGKQIYRAG